MRVKLQNILCATDLSDFSSFTLPYGMAMAEEFGSRLYVCHVIETRTTGLYFEAFLDPIEHQEQHLEFINQEFKEMVRNRKIEWEPLIGRGYPPDEIARLAEEHHIDLVITATHGRSGIKRLLLGSVTERLMRTLPCPLLVVLSKEKDAERYMDKAFRFERIMVGCDFSPDSSLAFQYALSFAQEFQSELHLVHVVEPSEYTDSQQNGLLKKTTPNSQIAARREARLIHMIPEEVGNWCTPITVVLRGRPYEELVRYATSHHIGIIFLGIHGQSLIENYLVGSTTDRVVRQAPCPVFSARPFMQVEAGNNIEK